MTWREFRQLHKASSNRQALNRSVRLLPGGAAALDALHRLHAVANVGSQRRSRPTASDSLAYDDARRIVDQMESDVRRRHGLPAGE